MRIRGLLVIWIIWKESIPCIPNDNISTSSVSADKGFQMLTTLAQNEHFCRYNRPINDTFGFIFAKLM